MRGFAKLLGGLLLLTAAICSSASGEPKKADGVGGRSLIHFGNIPIGATEQEFLRAYPRAKKEEDRSEDFKTLKAYVLEPPDSIDADNVRFLFVHNRLCQIDHIYGKKRLEERGGWQTDYEALQACLDTRENHPQ